MTDRYAGFLVTLADDVRSDEAEDVMNALRMVRGVVGVSPVVADGIELSIATARVDGMWRSRIVDMLNGSGS